MKYYALNDGALNYSIVLNEPDPHDGSFQGFDTLTEAKRYVLACLRGDIDELREQASYIRHLKKGDLK